MGLFDRIKRINANPNLNDGGAEDPEKNARTVYRKCRKTWCSCVRGVCCLTNALSNSTINPKMKPTGGNAMPAGFAKGDENLAHWSEKKFCRNCQYA